MKPKTKLLFSIFFLLSFYAFGQIETYTFKRELKGIKDPWHSITLPSDVFGETTKNLSDLRIYGITSDNDTIEAPYLIKKSFKKVSKREVHFDVINTSKNANGHYITFDVPKVAAINQIQLEFKEQNFDWKVTLEGSQNQKEWFEIVKDYRILSIKNELTDFKFTKLSFPNAKYRYYRLRIPTITKPNLNTAKIAQLTVIPETYRNHAIDSLITKESKKNKKTEITVDLNLPSAVAVVKIHVKDSFDYYRPVTISYLKDSIKTETGWKHNYVPLAYGTLNSIENEGFRCNNTILKKLKINIENHDNQPLEIEKVEVKGLVFQLVARFTKFGRYYLVYGNNKVEKPVYDIRHFRDKISEELTPLTLKDAQNIIKKEQPKQQPLFSNSLWLWAIMIVVILLLGWFSLRMIQKK